VLDVHGITMCRLGEEPTIATIMIAFGTSQEQALALLSFKNFKKELGKLGLPYKLVFNLPDSTKTAVPGQQAACMAMMRAMGLDMAPLQAAASMTVAAEREAAWKQAWAVLCKEQLDQVRHTIRTPNAVVAEEDEPDLDPLEELLRGAGELEAPEPVKMPSPVSARWDILLRLMHLTRMLHPLPVSATTWQRACVTSCIDIAAQLPAVSVTAHPVGTECADMVCTQTWSAHGVHTDMVCTQTWCAHRRGVHTVHLSNYGGRPKPPHSLRPTTSTPTCCLMRDRATTARMPPQSKKWGSARAKQAEFRRAAATEIQANINATIAAREEAVALAEANAAAAAAEASRLLQAAQQAATSQGAAGQRGVGRQSSPGAAGDGRSESEGDGAPEASGERTGKK
jgi:hypothetical protein